MNHRPILRTLAACALSAIMLGSATTFGQHVPPTPGTTSATADSDATPAATAVVTEGALAIGDIRTVDTAGKPLAISPDGKWLAGPGPDDDFCIWDVANLEPACASDRKRMAVQMETITWAPDSSAVAFSLDAARLLVDSDIYVMDIDGTLHDLTDDGEDDKITLQSDAPQVPVDMYPAWSPDSKHLIFARTSWSGYTKATALVAIDRAGGEPQERFVVSGQEPFIIYSPMHWLEDGTVIFSVLHADPGDKQNGVWRLTASGGVERIVAGDETAEIPMPFVNDVSPDGTLATVFSLSGASQFANDGVPVFFIVNLETGETHPVEAANPAVGIRIGSAGTFLPDGQSVLSVQMNGNRTALVLSGPDGTAIGSADLPEDSGFVTTFRGLETADDGTVFMPMMATSDAGGRGGILFTVEGA